jgi:acyl dehydratase
MSSPVTSRTFHSFEPGQELGTSEWLTVTQEMISKFGDATIDQDPMHVDPAWAAKGPFGHTIAFGFLTMSLLTHLMHRVQGTDSSRYDPAQGYYLNYGFDRVRLVAPVPVDSRIRATFKVNEIRPDAQGRSIVKFGVEVHVEGGERVALVAEWLTCWVPPVAS